MLHKKILDSKALALLESIMQNKTFDSFALTAGTALALRLAHRYSDDLDLWTTNIEFLYGGQLRKNVEHEMRMIANCERRVNDAMRSVFVVNDTFKIDFILDQTPYIATVSIQEGLRLFSLQDIAALKIDAVAGYAPRHNKKDFFDIYSLLVEGIFSLTEMFSFYEQREGKSDLFDVLKNLLVNMELADSSNNPRLIGGQAFNWSGVKNYFKNAVRTLCI